ncbi:NGFI-A-binding protein homolog [Bactrocera tryoni]|uniref:NGFI-A-binding protein homolog n=1 Tax=Bactrocera tryoni TaxID=59916 RepID=UPI001A99BFE0|nr:NGFI-A-binding protein homolog [Bactrocera tryoni]
MDPSSQVSVTTATTTTPPNASTSTTVVVPASTLATSAATTACALTTATTTISSTSNVSAPATVVTSGLAVGNQSATVLAPAPISTATAVGGTLSLTAACSQPTQPQQAVPIIDLVRGDDANNSSIPSIISEGQRSLSAAPSASSSPILSPPGKIFGRNANGTMVATSRPNNEAETQLYRVLQRASLLVYYDTLLEMGGDDVQQLYEAGEEEFLEIMALVGMASKPLHVRRLQKALHEWANNPTLFQGPITSTSSTPGLFDTPTKSTALHMKHDVSPSFTRTAFPTYNPTPSTFNPTPLAATSSHLISQICQPVIPMPAIQPHTPLPLPAATLPVAATPVVPPTLGATTGGSTTAGTIHQVSSSSPQLTPVLTEMQVARITQGAEKIARQLPQREPRAHTSKKRTSRELEQVIAMHENDPRRMDEIRKYSAIYGRFDCKRRPEKPLTLHEVCVNEAAAQLCRLVPALLTRRDELFPLARQIVKDAGFGHSASIARYGALLPQVMQAQQAMTRSAAILDCESSDSTASASSKRTRLASTETTNAITPTDLGLSRESTEDSRYNLFAMYQKFAKPPFDLTDISKFNLSKSEYDDNDNDSRLSFSNSSSPSMPPSSLDNERDLPEAMKFKSLTSFAPNVISSTAVHSGQELLDTSNQNKSSPSHQQRNQLKIMSCPTTDGAVGMLNSSPLGGVQVISAAGGHIIAVANPALALSPTLNEALSLKREANTPEM